VKLNHLLSIFAMFFIVACTQPMANSLLVDFSSECLNQGIGCTNSNASTNQLEISATNSALTKNIEDGDTIEISGTCVDQDHRNNRIVVEVYAGEDETMDPYFNNVNTDQCLIPPSNNNPVRSGLETVFVDQKALLIGPSMSYTFTASGGTPPYTFSFVSGGGGITAGGLYTSGASNGTDIIQVTDAAAISARAVITVLSGVATAVVTGDNKKCMTVTKGVGVVADAGLPNERTYPQCHNGQFSFNVRLGKVLLNATLGQPNYRYMVRYQLQSQDGVNTPSSTWGKVTIDRGLTTPIITSATNDPTTQKCTLVNSPARFNSAIQYTLNRTYTDIISTNAGSVNLFTNMNTLVTTTGASVYNWDDVGLTDGVTYNYTLTSTEMNYPYAPTTPTASSVVATCKMKRISIEVTSPATVGTCYFGLDTHTDVTTFNPYVTYEWGYMTTNNGWIGANGETNAGYTAAACGNTAVCTESGLTAGVNYFFALRAKNLATGEIGQWSTTKFCQPQ
jgi:hypothetical protein